MFYLTLTKEQEETRSYISIPASPNASEAQIIPADRADPNEKSYFFMIQVNRQHKLHISAVIIDSLLKTYLENIFCLFN